MVQFTLAGSFPTPLSHSSGKVFDPIFAGLQVPSGRVFKIFWQSASSSTLWYSLLWLAGFQHRSATPLGWFFDPIFAGSKSLGAEFLTYSGRARQVLCYGKVYFGSLASNPARPSLREGFFIPYLQRSKSLGAEFLTYSDRARRVLPYGTVYFGSLASNRTPPPLRQGFLIPNLRGNMSLRAEFLTYSDIACRVLS